MKVIGRLKSNLQFIGGMNKHQRALKAARAAKRLPLVGTTVVLLPFVEAAADAGLGLSTLTNLQTWRETGRRVIIRFFGQDPSAPGPLQSGPLLTTWLPIVFYAASYKLGIAKYASKALGKLGLRF